VLPKTGLSRGQAALAAFGLILIAGACGLISDARSAAKLRKAAAASRACGPGSVVSLWKSDAPSEPWTGFAVSYGGARYIATAEHAVGDAALVGDFSAEIDLHDAWILRGEPDIAFIRLPDSRATDWDYLTFVELPITEVRSPSTFRICGWADAKKYVFVSLKGLGPCQQVPQPTPDPCPVGSIALDEYGDQLCLEAFPEQKCLEGGNSGGPVLAKQGSGPWHLYGEHPAGRGSLAVAIKLDLSMPFAGTEPLGKYLERCGKSAKDCKSTIIRVSPLKRFRRWAAAALTF
jgi:LPXTG-motif cell wall-anchored protein